MIGPFERSLRPLPALPPNPPDLENFEGGTPRWRRGRTIGEHPVLETGENEPKPIFRRASRARDGGERTALLYRPVRLALVIALLWPGDPGTCTADPPPSSSDFP